MGGRSSLSRRLLFAFKIPNKTTLITARTGLLLGHPYPSRKVRPLKGIWLQSYRSRKWRTHTKHCIVFEFILHVCSWQDTDLPWILLSSPYLPHSVRCTSATQPEPIFYFQGWASAADSTTGLLGTLLPQMLSGLSLQTSEGEGRGKTCEPDLLYRFPRAPFCDLRHI